ncbi:glycosyltransferase [Synechococcales cyanobacterium C]|uniref:Glycosyltransferase n=1 Tax=Petrachloros mirabilis ULC683 TaxID=2781853 RepID=A0A8K2A0R8_9CYAN|nr:glycosyltransferase family 4 protein [Petrachloros mirabilis]NCJ07648.1 glycosyltransferase [Petrachloros mirabilis ULC683]
MDSRFIVAQNGARHGYAVPYSLATLELLERFYTDICGNVGFGKLLAQGKKMPVIGDRLYRLAGRQVPIEIQPLTYTFALPNLRWLTRTTLSSRDENSQFRLSCLKSLELGHAMVQAGFGKATHLYSMLGEFPPLLIAAEQQGLKVISDVYILLSTERILAEERKSFPAWEPDPPNYDAIRQELLPENVLLTRTQVFICPSEAVQDDLVQNYGIQATQTAVVPYGINPTFFDLKPNPIPRRILFVGTANLRKGIHYLAMAAEQLAKSGYQYEFRIAGNVDTAIVEKNICKHLKFLGRIPRDKIHQEFATADVFVLPSLAEGSAGVTYEALGAGVPVVTTRASGSVVRDGIEGYIVPERHPEAISRAIAEIVEDRSKRERMAIAARERSQAFTWTRYGERLINTLKILS